MLYFQKGWKSNPITFCTELLIADTYLKMRNGVVPLLDTAGPSTTTNYLPSSKTCDKQ